MPNFRLRFYCRMKEQRAAVLRRLARRSLREGATPRQAADLSRMSKGSNAPQVLISRMQALHHTDIVSDLL